MAKKIGIIALIILIIVLFVAPIRKHITNLFHNNKVEMAETKIIGPISGFNGRVKEIQKILEDLGFDPGSVDGRMGARTRLAIKEFQKKEGLTINGKIDSKTWFALNDKKEKIIKHILNPKIEPDPFLDTQEVINSNNVQSESEKTNQRSEIQDNIMGYRLKSKDRIRQTQMALKRAGFYKGKIDGKLGPQTKKAIKAFQKSKGLVQDGIIGMRTWEEIVKISKN